MYSNAEKGNKNNFKPSIYDIAGKVRDETSAKDEAAQILNAYRKVQDLRINNNSNNVGKKQNDSKSEIRKPQSQYANKVKETLRQLNANRKKELEQNKETQKIVINEKVNGIGAAERHLIQSGIRRLAKILDKKYEQHSKQAFRRIDKAGESENYQKQEKVRVWKLHRLFSGWQYETMLTKIQKEKFQKQQNQKLKRQDRLASDFNYFVTIKRFFKSWNLETKRAKKKRQFQLEQNLKRQQQTNKIEQQNARIERNKKKQVEVNSQLQSKIRGFLDGLKQQIQSKQRLITIKQKTEESFVRQDKQRDDSAQQNLNENQINENEQIQQQNSQQQVADVQVSHQGPLTNEQLEKKRKELQKKARHRKEALEKLKKQREAKRKQQEQERMALEKEIEEEQKKIRQQQYKKFMKQRKQEEEWKIREKELQRQAAQFDRLRLMRFYGWEFWKKLKQTNENNGQVVAELLNKIVLRRRLQKFVKGLNEIGQQKLNNAYAKADQYFCRRLKKQCVKRLKQWKQQQIQLKEELTTRHQVNTIKIYLKQWLRARDQIQLENYEWERPRIKRAECLHAMTLLSKAFQSLSLNRDQEIQNRNIEQHKAKIKEKVHKIVEEKPTINYDQFL